MCVCMHCKKNDEHFILNPCCVNLASDFITLLKSIRKTPLGFDDFAQPPTHTNVR